MSGWNLEGLDRGGPRANGPHMHTCPKCHTDVPCLWLSCSIEHDLSGPGEPVRGFYVECDACRARARGVEVVNHWRGRGPWFVAYQLRHPIVARCTSIEAAHAAARLLAGLCESST